MQSITKNSQTNYLLDSKKRILETQQYVYYYLYRGKRNYYTIVVKLIYPIDICDLF